MLDVHPAHHAATTWRDFFIHIATIVIGLLIAVGLEQTVEHFHHRHQISEARELLRNEREDNRQALIRATKSFRVVSAELQNNLQVLTYLQQHPGTPDEKLPGALVWIWGSPCSESAAWEAAQSSGVTSLMPREEVSETAKLYAQLHRIGDSGRETWLAITDAERYSLIDSRLSDLTPAQIEPNHHPHPDSFDEAFYKRVRPRKPVLELQGLPAVHHRNRTLSTPPRPHPG